MKKEMIVFMMLSSGQVMSSSNFDDFKVPASWTPEDVVNNLKQRRSSLNQYLDHHAQRDEFVADPQGFSAVQVEGRNSDAFQARKTLRQLKKSLHVE
jgi:hypothetical protein